MTLICSLPVVSFILCSWTPRTQTSVPSAWTPKWTPRVSPSCWTLCTRPVWTSRTVWSWSPWTQPSTSRWNMWPTPATGSSSPGKVTDTCDHSHVLVEMEVIRGNNLSMTMFLQASVCEYWRATDELTTSGQGDHRFKACQWERARLSEQPHNSFILSLHAQCFQRDQHLWLLSCLWGPPRPSGEAGRPP